METWLVLLHATSFKSNYHDNYKCTHTSLTISLGIQKTACLTNLFRGCSCCVETSHLICSAYRLTGFFGMGMGMTTEREWLLRGNDYWETTAMGMTTERVFRAGYTISFFVSLTLSLFDFLRLLLIIFKYLVYLVFFIKCFFIKCFFGTQDCAFPVSRGWVDFAHCNPGVMFTDVASWSLRLFLNTPVYWKVLHFQRCPLIWSIIVGQWGVLTIDTLLVN